MEVSVPDDGPIQALAKRKCRVINPTMENRGI